MYPDVMSQLRLGLQYIRGGLMSGGLQLYMHAPQALLLLLFGFRNHYPSNYAEGIVLRDLKVV